MVVAMAIDSPNVGFHKCHSPLSKRRSLTSTKGEKEALEKKSWRRGQAGHFLFLETEKRVIICSSSFNEKRDFGGK